PALGDRVKRIETKESELATRERAGDVRLQGRERSLDKRETDFRVREKELQEGERKMVARESDLKKEAARVAAKDEVIGEREAELMLKQERLRTEADRFERELADKGRLAQEAVSRAADLDRRELDLTAREAELNRLQAHIAHEERDANRGRDLEELSARLEEREKKLAERENDLTSYESVTDSQKKRTERREKRLQGMEETIHDRLKELDEREAELAHREASPQAAREIRTDKLDDRGPAAVAGPGYAFCPRWPGLRRASGSIPGWELAGVLVLAGSARAFLGVAAASPGGRRVEAALALACWPGSFALLLAYPDGLALGAAASAAALFMRQKPLAAAPLGAAAALLRPNGVLIALPLLWLSQGRGLSYKLAGLAPVAAAAAVEIFFWDRSGRAGAFFHAQRLWGRNGPSGIGHWADQVWDVVGNHTALVGLLVLGGTAAAVLVWRQFGFWPVTAAFAYVCFVPLLLVATHGLHGFVDGARCALVLPLLVVLWRLGPRYRPWAAYATVVVAALI